MASAPRSVKPQGANLGKKKGERPLPLPFIFGLPTVALVVIVTAFITGDRNFPLLNVLTGGGPPIAVALVDATTLTVLSGQAQVKSKGAADWKEGINGQTLTTGDAVKTVDGSAALVTYFEGSTTSIEDDAEIVLTKVEKNPNGVTTEISTQIVAGKTWTKVSKLLDPASSFAMETQSAVAVVRGTEFAVQVKPDGTTSVATADGEVAMAAPGQDLRTAVIVKPGFESSAAPGQPPSAPIPAPPPKRAIRLNLASPAVPLITDDKGRSTGCVSVAEIPCAMVANQIPGAEYSGPQSEPQTISFALAEGKERSIIASYTGTGTGGVYHIAGEIIDDGAIKGSTQFAANIKPNEIQQTGLSAKGDGSVSDFAEPIVVDKQPFKGALTVSMLGPTPTGAAGQQIATLAAQKTAAAGATQTAIVVANGGATPTKASLLGALPTPDVQAMRQLDPAAAQLTPRAKATEPATPTLQPAAAAALGLPTAPPASSPTAAPASGTPTTASGSPTASVPSGTGTPTPTVGTTGTPTVTATVTGTVTTTVTPTETTTVTVTVTETVTSTATPTATGTVTSTVTATTTATASATASPTSTVTATSTPSPTQTLTPTLTSTVTLTPTRTATPVGFTLRGSSVTIAAPGDGAVAKITFDLVTEPGITLLEADAGPLATATPPSGELILSNPFRFSTSAIFTGPITVEIPFDVSRLTAPLADGTVSRDSIRLLKWSSTASDWFEPLVTGLSVDSANGVLRATMRSLDPVAGQAGVTTRAINGPRVGGTFVVAVPRTIGFGVGVPGQTYLPVFSATNMAPGTTLSRTITVTNTTRKALSYRIKSQPASGAGDGTVFFTDPVQGLQLTVGRPGLSSFYCGPVKVDFAIPRDDTSGCTAGVAPTAPVKVLQPSQTDTLTLRVSLPESADNRFDGLQTTLEFVWTAVEQPLAP